MLQPVVIPGVALPTAILAAIANPLVLVTPMLIVVADLSKIAIALVAKYLLKCCLGTILPMLWFKRSHPDRIRIVRTCHC